MVINEYIKVDMFSGAVRAVVHECGGEPCFHSFLCVMSAHSSAPSHSSSSSSSPCYFHLSLLTAMSHQAESHLTDFSFAIYI